MKPQLIALYSAYPQCGKSTVASYLQEQHDYVIVPFAQTLKRMTKVLLEDMEIDAVDQLLAGDKSEIIADLNAHFPKASFDLRHVLRTLGTEWGRNCLYHDLWIDVWKNKTKTLLQNDRCICVDDTRFVNEAEAVRSLGGHLWLIQRSGSLQITNTNHASEGALNHWIFDACLVNNRSLSDLKTTIDYLLVP